MGSTFSLGGLYVCIISGILSLCFLVNAVSKSPWTLKFYQFCPKINPAGIELEAMVETTKL